MFETTNQIKNHVVPNAPFQITISTKSLPCWHLQRGQGPLPSLPCSLHNTQPKPHSGTVMFPLKHIKSSNFPMIFPLKHMKTSNFPMIFPLNPTNFQGKIPQMNSGDLPAFGLLSFQFKRCLAASAESSVAARS
jgi:hypothetical protein